METQLRNWIVSVLKSHLPLLRIAFSQRAKFERWLQLELACYAGQSGATAIKLECKSSASLRQRTDLCFSMESADYEVELKTANTNYRMAGVQNMNRPIKDNIKGIITDAQRLQKSKQHGIVGFVLFPIRSNDDQWLVYLQRIAEVVGVQLSEAQHCSRVIVPLDEDFSTEAIVCCFSVTKPNGAS